MSETIERELEVEDSTLVSEEKGGEKSDTGAQYENENIENDTESVVSESDTYVIERPKRVISEERKAKLREQCTRMNERKKELAKIRKMEREEVIKSSVDVRLKGEDAKKIIEETRERIRTEALREGLEIGRRQAEEARRKEREKFEEEARKAELKRERNRRYRKEREERLKKHQFTTASEEPKVARPEADAGVAVEKVEEKVEEKVAEPVEKVVEKVEKKVEEAVEWKKAEVKVNWLLERRKRMGMPITYDFNKIFGKKS